MPALYNMCVLAFAKSAWQIAREIGQSSSFGGGGKSSAALAHDKMTWHEL
jgi:hypothetical protein